MNSETRMVLEVSYAAFAMCFAIVVLWIRHVNFNNYFDKVKTK